jgi:hypothetical protein
MCSLARGACLSKLLSWDAKTVADWQRIGNLNMQDSDLDKKEGEIPGHRPILAEGVGLEPTSPFGQRFSRPSACQLA